MSVAGGKQRARAGFRKSTVPEITELLLTLIEALSMSNVPPPTFSVVVRLTAPEPVTCSVPPLNVNDPVPRFVLPTIDKVPPFKAVLPVYVFVPESTNVPVLLLTMPPRAEIVPLNWLVPVPLKLAHASI